MDAEKKCVTHLSATVDSHQMQKLKHKLHCVDNAEVIQSALKVLEWYLDLIEQGFTGFRVDKEVRPSLPLSWVASQGPWT